MLPKLDRNRSNHNQFRYRSFDLEHISVRLHKALGNCLLKNTGCVVTWTAGHLYQTQSVSIDALHTMSDKRQLPHVFNFTFILHASQLLGTMYFRALKASEGSEHQIWSFLRV